MKWVRPQFEEVSLALEVKGYVDVDDAPPSAPMPRAAVNAAATSEPVRIAAAPPADGPRIGDPTRR